MALVDEVLRGQVAGHLVVGRDGRHRLSGHMVKADHRERVVEHMREPDVLLHLRRDKQNSVDAPLHHCGKCVLGPGALRLDARDHHPIALASRLALGADDRPAEVAVAEIAGDQTDGLRALHHQAARLQVGHVAELARDLEDAGSRRHRRRSRRR